MTFFEYQKGVGIAPHDYAFKESHFVLSGEIEGVLDSVSGKSRRFPLSVECSMQWEIEG